VGFAHQNLEAVMYRLFFILIALLATPLVAEDKNVGDKKTFEVKGKFSVGVPEDGYEWKKIQDIKAATIIGAAYTCEKKDSKKIAVLTILNQKSKTDKERRAYIEGNLNGFRKRQEKSNGTIVSGDKPAIEEKIPDQVSYSLKAQNSDGSVLYAQATIIFGRNTFTILTMNPNSDEAKEFNEEITKTFKELDK
jgi:hypothetical protein